MVAESDDWLVCVVGLFFKPSKFWKVASRLEGAACPILSVVGLLAAIVAFAVVSVLWIGGKGGGGGGGGGAVVDINSFKSVQINEIKYYYSNIPKDI